MHKRLFVTLAVSAAFSGVLAASTTASAEPNPPGCEKSYFCIYAGEGQTGQLLVKSEGNWTRERQRQIRLQQRRGVPR
ncbi:hypothetical protein RKD34_007985 [Streptomyces sp. SAI-218]